MGDFVKPSMRVMTLAEFAAEEERYEKRRRFWVRLVAFSVGLVSAIIYTYV